MKIGILSDSHDNMNAIRKAVEFFNREMVDQVLHAGDIISPFTMNEFKGLRAPLWAVFGNNDGEKHFLREKIKGIGEIAEGHFEKEWEGRRIIVMHEPRRVQELKAGGIVDVLVYGHTHKVDVQEGRPLVLNPGEAGGWLTGKCTVALFELPSLEVRIVELPK
jgi:uncharacterized protein